MLFGNTEVGSGIHLPWDITPEVVKFIQTEVYELHEEIKKTEKEKALSKKEDKDKEKAQNLPATYLKVGNYEVTSMNEGHIIAKFYFNKRRLIWEILEGPLKKKIDIPWSDISGIMADLNSGILKVELNERPLLQKEIGPKPGKHTIWGDSDDFTGNQASSFRIHTVRFAPRTLDRLYEKLLSKDNRLNILSTCLFPTELALDFDKNIVPMLPLPSPLDYPDLSRIVSGGSNPVGNYVLPGERNLYRQPSLDFHRISYSQVTNNGMMNNGLENDLLNLHSNTTFNSRGVMINHGVDNTPQYLDTMPNTGEMRMMNDGLENNNVSNDVAQLSTLNTRGMMMNRGMENNVSNDTAQHSTLNTRGMMMNRGMENNVLNNIPQFPDDTMLDNGGMTMNLGSEYNVSNNNAQHSTLNTAGMMMNHRLENVNMSNNVVPRFDTRHNTAGGMMTMMMNPEIKIESCPYSSNINSQHFNGALNTGGAMMDPEMMMEFNNAQFLAAQGMLNHGMENQLVNNSPSVYTNGESSIAGLSDPDLNSLQQQINEEQH